MNIAGIALIATLVILVVAVFDAVRGRTAIGTHRLGKMDEDPTRFWFAIVLYINMAIGMFWLTGQVDRPEPAPLVVTYEEPPQ